VGVTVGVNVAVGDGVSVQASAVAVMAVAVRVACISGDGPQAVRTTNSKMIVCSFFIPELYLYLFDARLNENGIIILL
jgi:hypothetical protein